MPGMEHQGKGQKDRAKLEKVAEHIQHIGKYRRALKYHRHEEPQRQQAPAQQLRRQEFRPAQGQENARAHIKQSA